MNEEDILLLIEQDSWMMKILRIVRKLDLPDWWIGAGFVRSKVWDTLHEYETRTPIPDIDVIYFDNNDFSNDEAKTDTTKAEKKYEKLFIQQNSHLNWSVTNQARMHLFHNDKPYKNSTEALSRWVETATCIGVTLNKKEQLTLSAPYGIDDLVSLKLRPTFTNNENLKTFHERVNKKNWLKKWPRLKVVEVINSTLKI